MHFARVLCCTPVLIPPQLYESPADDPTYTSCAATVFSEPCLKRGVYAKATDSLLPEWRTRHMFQLVVIDRFDTPCVFSRVRRIMKISMRREKESTRHLPIAPFLKGSVNILADRLRTVAL